MVLKIDNWMVRLWSEHDIESRKRDVQVLEAPTRP